jgi:membrane protein
MRRLASVVRGWALTTVIARTAQHAYRDDITGMAGDLAFRFFLALFPFIIFLAALGGFIAAAFDIANPSQRIVSSLGNELPADVARIIQTQLRHTIGVQSTGLLSVGIAGTLIAASSGFSGLFKAFNRAYGAHESRPLWERYIFSLGLTLLSGTLTAAAFTLLVLGEIFGPPLVSDLHIPGAYRTLITVGRWGTGIVLILAAVIMLYRVIPDRKVRLVRALPGAALFAVAWSVTTSVFAIYLQRFAQYNATYGALGGAAILLIWFYLTALILLIGAELNAVIAGRAGPLRADLRPRRIAPAPRENGIASAKPPPDQPPESSAAAAPEDVSPPSRR